jgi:chemotaxis protein MotB
MPQAAIRPLAMTVLAMVLATGCCEQEKEQISALKNSNDQLLAQNKDYRDQIGQLERTNAELRMQAGNLNSQLANKNETITDLQARLSERTTDVTGTAEGWEKGKFGDKVTVGSDILFPPGKATLTASGKQTLSGIVRELKGRYAGLPVRVYGYTDSDPIKKSRKLWKDNLDLSANRAMAVTRYLREQGIPEDTIETVGMGATHFVAPNTSKAGKAKNRRVEIMVVKVPQ